MLFGSHHRLDPFTETQKRFGIERLDGADVDHPDADSFLFKLPGSLYGLLDHDAGGKNHHILAFDDLCHLADVILGIGIGDHRQVVAVDADVHRPL
ncbi:hypothetical protein DSECCO2_561130 [anaerobic digester metagenome]